MQPGISDYHYSDAECGHAHEYLVPKVEEIIQDLDPQANVFDLGCGNGSVAAHLHQIGCTVSGVDPSTEGIKQANQLYPELDLHVGSAYDNLRDEYGQFEITLSLEVVEHVYAPQEYARTLHSLTKPGGHTIISTPYHGYLKNLLIALKGGWGDDHYNPLWKNGHIKIWTPKKLSNLLMDTGFENPTVFRVGRIPPIAKSMVIVASKPTQ